MTTPLRPRLRTAPLYDRGFAPAPAEAGSTPAARLWGVGRATEDKIKQALGIRKARLSIADFAYAPLDALDLGAQERELLRSRQFRLINGERVPLQAADPRLTAALRADIQKQVSQALAALSAGPRADGWVAEQIGAAGRSVARSYGVVANTVRPASDAELAAAQAAPGGLPLGPTEIAFVACWTHDLDSDPRPGKVVFGLDPARVLQPMLARHEGRTLLGTTLAASVPTGRAMLLERGPGPDGLLAALTGLTADLSRDLSAASPAARPGVLLRLDALIEEVDRETAGLVDSVLRAEARGALAGLRRVRDAFAAAWA